MPRGLFGGCVGDTSRWPVVGTSVSCTVHGDHDVDRFSIARRGVASITSGAGALKADQIGFSATSASVKSRQSVSFFDGGVQPHPVGAATASVPTRLSSHSWDFGGFLNPIDGMRVDKLRVARRGRTSAPHAVVFQADDEDDVAGMADATPDEEREEAPEPEWENTEGLPSVVESQGADQYFSPDIADSDLGKFRPNLGCKCKDWRPAPAHPAIQFKDEWLEAHKDFRARLDRLRVHMEDTTKDPPVVHWDAEYDMQRFGDDEDRIMLKESASAVRGVGSQVRFMTFCPDDGKPHEYSLKVTALDKDGNVMDELKESESTYQATPPEEGENGGGATEA